MLKNTNFQFKRLIGKDGFDFVFDSILHTRRSEISGIFYNLYFLHGNHNLGHHVRRRVPQKSGPPIEET